LNIAPDHYRNALAQLKDSAESPEPSLIPQGLDTPHLSESGRTAA
jgi:hypothetical protein